MNRQTDAFTEHTPWLLTDDATGQHVRSIAGEQGAYRFIDTTGLGAARYAVVTDEVCLTGQELEDPEFIRAYLRPYGYDGRDDLHRVYGDAALQVAAECVFETDAHGGQILFEGTPAECLRFIDAMVRRERAG